MLCSGRRAAGGVWRAVFGGWRAAWAYGVRRVACSRWQEAGGRRRMVAEIMTSVDIIV